MMTTEERAAMTAARNALEVLLAQVNGRLYGDDMAQSVGQDALKKLRDVLHNE